MNHRERVVAAIRHQPVDRMPVDLGGMRSTGIMAIAYHQLKQRLGITEGELRIFDATQQLAYVEAPIRERFGCDVVILDLGLLQGWRDYTLPDGTPAKITAKFQTEPDGEGGEFSLDDQGRRVGHRPKNSYYFDKYGPAPLAEAETIEDLDRYPWRVYTDEELEALRSEARRLYEETDYAILGSFGGAFLEGGQGLRGWDQFMMDLAGNRAFAEALLDRMLAHYLRNVELYLDAVGDYIQIIQMGGDMGTQNGPQIRPKMYYEIFQPREKELWGRIHSLKPEVSIFLHCCGGIYELIPGIIDAGCDILNPVQFSARGMDPERLKSEFGDRLCFWGGGCDTQTVLPFASPQEVYDHTRRQIEILKPGSGFVFTQVHNIQAGVPVENILAMYQAVQDCW
ncbi:MAG: methyltransferase [Chloroflexi bacterium]|mgnify:CR=1 FL=1|nr:methyltransferase [Chloroflexota bacterium]